MAGIPKVNYEKKIVCLATSRKPGGRCVAGKEVVKAGPAPWIRPVSVRPGAEIELTERHYNDGTEPKLLDIVRIPMLAPNPRLHQTENHMIDASFYWQKAGAFDYEDLDQLEDTPATLWINTDPSTYHGSHDRVSQTLAVDLKNSLLLIKPNDVTIEVLTPGANFGSAKRAVRADFHYKGVRYNLMVTDPDVEKNFFARENGTYKLKSEAYFCISLAEAHTDGYCYKLVASIITEGPL